MKTVVVVPTYNERENIAAIIGRVRVSVPTAHVLVVDDNSPDGTGVVADGLALDDAHVHVLHRPAKQGLGAAYRAGFAWALANAATVIVEMDADGSHRPEDMPRLLEALQTADVAIGSRWVAGGEVVNWPLRRELLSRGGSTYARAALGLKQKDVTGGYRAFRADALQLIDYETVESAGYCFQIEMLWRSADAGLTIREVPITFAERTAGTSKMSSRIVWEALVRVSIWAISPVPQRRRAVQPAPAPLERPAP